MRSGAVQNVKAGLLGCLRMLLTSIGPLDWPCLCSLVLQLPSRATALATARLPTVPPAAAVCARIQPTQELVAAYHHALSALLRALAGRIRCALTITAASVACQLARAAHVAHAVPFRDRFWHLECAYGAGLSSLVFTAVALPLPFSFYSSVILRRNT